MGNWYEYDFTGKRVLLVDDNQINIFMQQRLLEEIGFVVETAENGKEGVETFVSSDEYYFDAILMDINMPIMDGWTATEQIRKLARTDADKVPIFALTTNGYDEDVCRSMAAGMNEHLVKPINPEKLCSYLARYLKQQ